MAGKIDARGQPLCAFRAGEFPQPGTSRLHDVHAVQHIEALDRRGADDLGGKPHQHRARTDNVAHRRLADGQFLPTPEPRVFRERGDGLGERTGEVEEKPVLSLAITATYGKMLLITGSLCS